MYGWALSQKLPVNDFKLVEEASEFKDDFVESWNDEGDEKYFLEVDFQYPENLHNIHNDAPFFPERMKIEKAEKFVANWHDETEYVIHLRNLEQALHHGLVLKSHQV